MRRPGGAAAAVVLCPSLMAEIERVGFVGWRGMVGSVLLDRMREEGDFRGLAPSFYSTSQVGAPAPDVGVEAPHLLDAYSVDALKDNEVILTCQGGDYTKRVLPELRAAGWDGYWIDAASAKRMDDDSVIILDPINRAAIDRALDAGTKNYIGGNCTVSLMLMALGGLFEAGMVEWLSSMTYQAASGAGAKAMRELVGQMRRVGDDSRALLEDPASAILALDRQVKHSVTAESFPTDTFGAPLAASLIPWIDRKMEGGETREEWKGHVETNKILGAATEVPVDGICVRVGTMRCHSQAFTVKLKRDVPLDEIEERIAAANEWVTLVDNDKEATLAGLSPARVSGTLEVPVGRLRKLRMGGDYLGAFSVGDQLLWGAAEPLRRMLQILRTR